jgi:2-dehydropantoate 2-reductase
LTLARELEAVGPVKVTSNVRGMIWSKLLINSTFTGLSAVSGLRYGPASEQGRDAVFALWGEGVAVADAQGLALEDIHGIRPHAFDDAALGRYMDAGSANVRPSMLQDLDAGRETEVDVVNGGVAARGRELGVPTPCNDAVVELVHSMERGERSPDPRWLHYVSEAQTTSATDS